MSDSTGKTKPGVASVAEIRDVVQSAGNDLLVIDLRNPDAVIEPHDQPTFTIAPLPSENVRPKAIHLKWDRETGTMPLPEVPLDTPIITHCGAGGRGLLAKEYLMANGFTNVVNGGGPKETELWKEFGQL